MSTLVTFTAESIEAVTAVVGTKWGPLRLLWSEGGGLRLDRVPLHKDAPSGLTLAEVRELTAALKGGAKLGGGLQESKKELEAVKSEQVQAIAEVAARALSANEIAARALPANDTVTDVAKQRAAEDVDAFQAATKIVEEAANAAAQPAVNLAQVEDMSVFVRLTKMADIVAEIRKRGAASFEDIWAYLQQVDDADMCPALDRIKRTAPLQERLRSYCASINVPGAL